MAKYAQSQISIHAPPRGATDQHHQLTSTISHFNSRPSARGDALQAPINRVHGISIHAPPRGATDYWAERIEIELISIHAPPRGATMTQATLYIGLNISIHAPPRGATSAAKRWKRFSPDFNSRPSARGDGKRYAISANLLFNPYKSAWLNNRATQFVEIILVIFHRIIA